MSLSSKTAKTTTSKSSDSTNIDCEKVPKLDQHSLDLLRRLVNYAAHSTSLEFEDNLKTFSFSGDEIGEFTVKVKNAIYNNEDCFHIIAKSTGTLDNVPCGTELHAYVNRSLETLEQDFHEYIKIENRALNRRTIIIKENDSNYTITQTNVEPTGTKSQTRTIMSSLMTGYISEASNLLLQRLIIQKSVIEEFSLYTFDTNLNPCMVHYKLLDKRNLNIKDVNYEIIGLERHIESLSEIPTTWQMYFTNDGHMVNRVQVGSPAVMKAIEPPKSIEIDEYLPIPVIEKKELNWESDIQLQSQFVERKDELINEYNQYLQDHPELKHLLADFVQSVLSNKPDDVLKFSSQFFAPYSSKTSKNRLFPATNNPTNIPKH